MWGKINCQLETFINKWSLQPHVVVLWCEWKLGQSALTIIDYCIIYSCYRERSVQIKFQPFTTHLHVDGDFGNIF